MHELMLVLSLLFQPEGGVTDLVAVPYIGDRGIERFDSHGECDAKGLELKAADDEIVGYTCTVYPMRPGHEVLFRGIR